MHGPVPSRRAAQSMMCGTACTARRPCARPGLSASQSPSRASQIRLFALLRTALFERTLTASPSAPVPIPLTRRRRSLALPTSPFPGPRSPSAHFPLPSSKRPFCPAPRGPRHSPLAPSRPKPAPHCPRVPVPADPAAKQPSQLAITRSPPPASPHVPPACLPATLPSCSPSRHSQPCQGRARIGGRGLGTWHGLARHGGREHRTVAGRDVSGCVRAGELLTAWTTCTVRAGWGHGASRRACGVPVSTLSIGC